MHEQCPVNCTKKKNNENFTEQLCHSKYTRNSFTENMKFKKVKSRIFSLEQTEQKSGRRKASENI